MIDRKDIRIQGVTIHFNYSYLVKLFCEIDSITKAFHKPSEQLLDDITDVDIEILEAFQSLLGTMMD